MGLCSANLNLTADYLYIYIYIYVHIFKHTFRKVMCLCSANLNRTADYLYQIFVLFSKNHEASLAPVEQQAPLATSVVLQAAV